MNSLKGNKKIYSKPELEVVVVDHEISLVMMTSPPPDPDPDEIFGAASTEGMSTQKSVQEYTPSSQNYPFGSSTPDYNN